MTGDSPEVERSNLGERHDRAYRVLVPVPKTPVHLTL